MSKRASEPRDDKPHKKPSPQQQEGLPRGLRIVLVSGSFALMVGHVIYDAVVAAYEGASVSLMLGGLVGTALGFNEWLRNKGDSS